MHSDALRRTRLWLMGVVLIVAGLALAGCGSASSTGTTGASGSVQSLLQQTFSSSHTVRSGVLGFAVTVDPSGSSVLTSPISLTLSGPFQSHGTGKLPSSDFTVQIAALGKQGALGVISTGTAGYVTLDGSAYQLPQAQYKKLEQGLSSAGSGGGGLAGLGINPQRWLQNPSVVGTQTVDGAPTTEIRAGVNGPALLSDLNTFLSRTTKGGSANAISPASQQKIAAAVKNATVDIWTGTSDKVLRKLTLSLTLPVTGQTSSALGGMTSAGIGLTVQYAHLNQPQSVSAPAHVLPYSQFTTKLRSTLSGLLGSGSSTAAPAPSSSTVTKYSECIQAAGQDVAKMQKCAVLLNGAQ